jgi:hypothetical protein
MRAMRAGGAQSPLSFARRSSSARRGTYFAGRRGGPVEKPRLFPAGERAANGPVVARAVV